MERWFYWGELEETCHELSAECVGVITWGEFVTKKEDGRQQGADRKGNMQTLCREVLGRDDGLESSEGQLETVE